jgi:lipopolysaccharide heptosyltransferase II
VKSLQILPSLDIGGVERGVIDIARAAKQRGEDIVVVSSGGALVSELHKIGVKHYELPVHKKSLKTLKQISKLVEIIDKERIDVVHARSRVPAWIAYFACRKARVPLVTTCHGYYSNHLLSRVMGWGKRVIAISRVVGRRMIDDFGVSPERLRLVHRGIDLNHFKFVEGKYTTAKSTFKIINVGRLSPIKGQVEFLKAIHHLRADISNIEVWLVGSEVKGKHKYTDKIKETIEKLGLSSCVQLLGTRRDIPELLAQADLLVLGTLIPEAFGRVIVEAGAVGTAVITTRVGGVLDIIDDGYNGVLVPPGDIPAMAQAMKCLLLNPEKCRELTLNLKEKVDEYFSVQQMFEKTFAVYDEAVSDKKILIIKLGAMGDVVLITPSLRMIRNTFPKAKISMIIDKKHAPLISNSPYVDEVIPVDRKKFSNIFFLLRFAKKIRQEGFDVSVDFQNNKWTHLFSYFSGATERYGFHRGGWKFLLNQGVNVASKPESPIENQFRILNKLGVKKMDSSLELWDDKETDTMIRTQFYEWTKGSEEPVIGFVLGSSPKWKTKRWPIEKYEELAKKIMAEFDARIVLFGSPDDMKILKGLFLEKHDKILNLIGKTSVKEMSHWMKKIDLLVSGDTAPLHVGAARNVHLVALFGPTDPKRHMPPVLHSNVHVKHLECQPCYQGVCKNSKRLACLVNISVQEVFTSIQTYLKSRHYAVNHSE